MLECVAPLAAHLDRFLAPTPVLVVVGNELRDVTAAYDAALAVGRLEDEPEALLLGESALTRQVLPAMIVRAKELAGERSRRLIDVALSDAKLTLGTEVQRLSALARVNLNVRMNDFEGRPRSCHRPSRTSPRPGSAATRYG